MLESILFSHAEDRKCVHEWYKLATDCVNSSSINIVKNIIDNYLVRARYTYINNCGLSISQRLPFPHAAI